MANPFLEAALSYAERGWSVIPLQRRDKRPLVEWKAYQQRRATAEEIEGWWRTWPEANVGVVTGAISGLIVLDADGPDGAESLTLAGGAPYTPHATTGKGEHYYLAHPGGGARNFARKLPGLDLRGDGGYVVAPPSIHPSGAAYVWVVPPNGAHVAGGGLAAPPPWLRDLLKEPTPTPATNGSGRAAYAQAALADELSLLARAREGQRNDQLNKSAFALSQLVTAGLLDEHATQAALSGVGRAIGLGEKEIAATIRSAFTKGAEHPRHLPEPTPARTRPATVAAVTAPTPMADDEIARMLASGIWLDELMEKELPPIRWIVPGLIPEGVTVFAGKAKMGKSWLCLSLAMAIASGGRAFGSIEVEQGKVLYLPLEDNERRLKNRAEKLLGGRKAPKGIKLHTEWVKLDAGGVALVEGWMQAHPDTRLVIVDTFAKVRPGADPRSNFYDQDYAALQGLRDVAARYQIAIVVIHHLRKAASDDPVDLINATSGLGAAADALLIMRRERGEDTASLYVTGKEIEDDKDLAIKWDATTAQWTILGDADEHRLSSERQAIINAIRDSGEALGPKEVSDLTGAPWASTRRLMAQMGQAGELVNDRGKYSIPKRKDKKIWPEGDHPAHPEQGAQGAHPEQLIEQALGDDRGARGARGDRGDRGDRVNDESQDESAPRLPCQSEEMESERVKRESAGVHDTGYAPGVRRRSPFLPIGTPTYTTHPEGEGADPQGLIERLKAQKEGG